MVCDVPASPGPTPSSARAVVLDPPASTPMAVLRAVGEELVPVGPWPLDARAAGDVVGTGPWTTAARIGVPLRLAAAELDAAVAEQILDAGAGGVRCRPIWADGALAGVAVELMGIERPVDAPASAAELDAMEEHGRRLLGVGDALTEPPVCDPVTGAAACGRLAERIGRDDGDAVFLNIDLDGLDAINLAYGAAGGDAVLTEVARRLEAIVRDGDLVVRTVGDEFVVVIRGAGELESIELVAAVVDALGLPFDLSPAEPGRSDGGRTGGLGELVAVTAGVGMCVPNEGTSIDLALHTAHLALDEAKRSGRDRLHIIGR